MSPEVRPAALPLLIDPPQDLDAVVPDVPAERDVREVAGARRLPDPAHRDSEQFGDVLRLEQPLRRRRLHDPPPRHGNHARDHRRGTPPGSDGGPQNTPRSGSSW